MNGHTTADHYAELAKALHANEVRQIAAVLEKQAQEFDQAAAKLRRQADRLERLANKM